MGGGKLVAANESTVNTESLFDAIVMEDLQNDRGFPDPPGTDESNGSEVFGHIDDPVDQLVTAKTGPRCRWRGFARNAKWKCKTEDPSLTEVADLG